MTGGEIIAGVALYLMVGMLFVFAFGRASQRSDALSDDVLDLIDGDIRPADLIRVRDADGFVPPHGKGS